MNVLVVHNVQGKRDEYILSSRKVETMKTAVSASLVHINNIFFPYCCHCYNGKLFETGTKYHDLKSLSLCENNIRLESNITFTCFYLSPQLKMFYILSN